jgi:hypothetical protein
MHRVNRTGRRRNRTMRRRKTTMRRTTTPTGTKDNNNFSQDSKQPFLLVFRMGLWWALAGDNLAGDALKTRTLILSVAAAAIVFLKNIAAVAILVACGSIYISPLITHYELYTISYIFSGHTLFVPTGKSHQRGRGTLGGGGVTNQASGWHTETCTHTRGDEQLAYSTNNAEPRPEEVFCTLGFEALGCWSPPLCFLEPTFPPSLTLVWAMCGIGGCRV